jgi:hypothetical protein
MRKAIVSTLSSPMKNIMKGYDATLKHQNIKKILQGFLDI